MKHSCKEASKLASDSLDRSLSLWEKLTLRFHLSMCGRCKNCNETIQLIRKTANLISQSRNGDVRLSHEQRESLHKALDEKRNC